MSHEPGRERHTAHLCERCRTRLHELYHYEPRDEYLCDNCISNYEEAAYMRHQQDLMENGPGPTLAEQQAEARKLK